MNTRKLRELAQLFLKLGIIGFGGPAAHIAMMEEEVVQKRRWLSREHFLDLLGATNLIPGPNSTEMAIHVGYTYGGVPGLVVAGVCFLFPAITITGILAWVYQAFGTLPAVAPLLYGIKPAVLVVIFGALWRLGKKAIKSRTLLIIALGVVPLLLLGLNEVLALLVGGVVGMFWLRWQIPHRTSSLWVAGLNASALAKPTVALAATTAKVTPPLWQLGLVFLKVGVVLFGSGYVLIAFLEGELVGRGWLTQQELLDAIAIGQFTPGPVLSTSTFIGYVVSGFPGAMVATVGIFLPSFLFVLAVNPLIPKMRQSVWAGAFLDAVNVSAVALMAVVTGQLAFTLLWQPLDGLAWGIVGLSAIALFWFKLGPVWLVLGGAILGYVASL
ncbi:chromate efflux transporter [Spirulina sp. CS-785/01]|uniref:chromate efflux transporter n=1 Tax=Spirulina sp. CS-785/01 TaxID=3021716 RepID=UPI00232A9989|nr:chromate efflux transporter [Spirulina sp. CS-785/01]MDB9312854.1 chromate efflux transporter [Spirulina sp. CS-785/01]